MRLARYRSRLNYSGTNTADRYHKYTSGVVVVLIQRPEYQTGDLENIKRMKSLPKITLSISQRTV